MRKRTAAISIAAAALLLALIAAPIMLAPTRQVLQPQPIAAVDSSEHARTIAAMRPRDGGPKRDRPAIAIVTLNDATEVADLLVAYGVLEQADVADVTVVAERAAPVRLYPGGLQIEPQATMRAFDQRFSDGADYVVVPALDPSDDKFVVDWIAAQRRKGARIVSICNGYQTLAAAGLLDGRRATGHWHSLPQVQAQHPAMQWVPDRRYAADDGIMTSTGVSANVPVMMALVEAIGGRPAAERVAGDLGVEHWDARHRSADFRLTLERKKTFIRNKLAFWRHEAVGVPVAAGVGEIALGLTIDAWSRTELAEVFPVADEPVRSRHGLTIGAQRALTKVSLDHVLPPVPADAPALTMERELARIANRYDRATADIVALTMEYPWRADGPRTVSR